MSDWTAPYNLWVEMSTTCSQPGCETKFVLWAGPVPAGNRLPEVWWPYPSAETRDEFIEPPEPRWHAVDGKPVCPKHAVKIVPADAEVYVRPAPLVYPDAPPGWRAVGEETP